MAKFPARQNDLVNNNSHGNGYIMRTSNPTVTFEGQPVACSDDPVIFADSTQSTILEGNACVMVNGKRIALLEDQTSEGGIINSSATTIQIDEGKPFVFIGSNVSIGKNVKFTCEPKETYNQHFIIYHDKTGEPLSNVLYRITTPQGVFQGNTDNKGRTTIVSSDNADEITIEIVKY
ncbi:MAG TPA: PAAR domain-containing protein [Gammaproteobacteria bacterium]|nr:PAAR domain-containing protein [Gammaproteobacteria bacterium]